MTFQGKKRYTFVSDAESADTFTVVRFSGHEALSRPYRFEIELATEDAEINLHAMLQKPARFEIHRGDQNDRVFSGVLAEFEHTKASGGHVIYKAVLVPRLWNAGLYHENQLFMKKSVKDIIKEVLQQTCLTAKDYTFRLTGAYPPWEYLCQWRETDLNFIHRWMEREGIYYYFAQNKQKEMMVITDSLTSHQPTCEQYRIPYSTPSAMISRNQEVIHAMVCRQRRLPNRVILRDYNYRRPSLELKAEATVDPAGHGEVYFYGDHFKTPEEGKQLADIHAQELLCRQCVYNGESTAANLCAGYLFTLYDHYRESHNRQYLVVEVQHQGHQAIAGLSGQKSELSDGEKQMGYTNQFTAIPADIQFRPERSAVRPKFYGTLNATVDASGNSEYAEIDDQGRYKVIMPFDRSGIGGGRASRWIRMAQPYAGNNYGMHFPLHSGTEVLLTFVDGDPDRPIIAGSVPNPENASPVNTSNQTQSMIRTGGGNQLRLEDNAGGQQIHLSSPTEGSIISLGAPNEGNLYMKTGGTSVMKVGNNSTRVISGTEQTTVEQDNAYNINGNDNLAIKGNRSKSVDGKENTTVKGDHSKTVTGMETISVTGDVDQTYKANLKTTVADAINIESTKSSVKIKANREICLEVGQSKLHMYQDGTIELTGEALAIAGKSIAISGENVTSEASQVNTHNGDQVIVNGTSTATLKGGVLMLNP